MPISASFLLGCVITVIRWCVPITVIIISEESECISAVLRVVENDSIQHSDYKSMHGFTAEKSHLYVQRKYATDHFLLQAI
jgi:hypothetical protein